MSETAVSAEIQTKANSSSKVSKIFRSGGDVVFRSSDDVLFHIQQKYLEANSESFPLAEHTAPSLKNEVVPLTETSTVLELLFQFTYPQMPPDLDDLEFPALMELAEAAEKYLIHHARKYCLMRMSAFVAQYPLEIFAFAAEHDHEKMLYEVAPRLAFKPLSEIAYRIPSSIYVPWSFYHDQFTSKMWKQVIEQTVLQPNSIACTGNNYHTTHWRDHVTEWRVKVGNDPSLLSDIEGSLGPMTREYQGQCCNAFVNWRDDLKKKLNENTLSLEYLVKQHRTKMSGRVF